MQPAISEVGFIKKKKYDKTYMHSNDFAANFGSRELIIKNNKQGCILV